MKVEFFGRLAEAIGTSVEIEVREPCSIAELRERLARTYPSAAGALERRTRACVGDTIVADTHLVDPGDVVGFLPPVSGG